MNQAKVVYINFNKVLCNIAIIILVALVAYFLWDWHRVLTIEIGSDNRKSKYTVENVQQIPTIKQLLKDIKPSLKQINRNQAYHLKMYSKRKTQVAYFNSDGTLMQIQGQVFQTGPKLRLFLNKAVKKVNQLSSYGELVSWTEVNQLIPIGTVTTAYDLETGRTFKVKRIGGVGHADMEPVTATDSEVVKELYGGEWSWKRRAVVVRHNGLKLAASMNGMPHDQDDNPNNGIKGHFCIYFFQSKHPKGRDLAHELMIQKAGGGINNLLARVNDQELLHLFITALDQGDGQLLQQFIGDRDTVAVLQKKQIISCTIKKIHPNGADRYRMKLQVSYKNGPYNTFKFVNITLRRNPSSGTQIGNIELQKM